MKPKTIFTGNACIELSTIVAIRKQNSFPHGTGKSIYYIMIDREGSLLTVECNYEDQSMRNNYYTEWCREWAGKP